MQDTTNEKNECQSSTNREEFWKWVEFAQSSRSKGYSIPDEDDEYGESIMEAIRRNRGSI